jgi:hypothetical protein
MGRKTESAGGKHNSWAVASKKQNEKNILKASI